MSDHRFLVPSCSSFFFLPPLFCFFNTTSGWVSLSAPFFIRLPFFAHSLALYLLSPLTPLFFLFLLLASPFFSSELALTFRSHDSSIHVLHVHSVIER
ncbi:hypothetical protein F5H01DRAFT_359534 [Linnemannia elongata]|nr:hypothetical protein F5H01DRAFT_359534 [Linnemannia elongata]